ncbi:hypothetical protein JKP88DRAFT_172531 [Tribonema minus]|uniref:RNA-polymerase II-associated protein 3-like C-terminal domain-containing protein n=1 Tax=Tribonema minus TaxID=303371 RepID=A0A836C7R2_9STRA|nr:hypothetical protein JKP88DRAFT_172531 [Tribonema minus]
MESLGHQQKGWRKTASKPPPKHKAGAAADKTASSKLVRKGPLQAPTTQSEFERDWRRRCKTHADMVALLGLVGASGMPKLFKVELDPQLLGQILGVLSRCAAADSALPPCQPRNSSSDDGDAANGHQAGGGESVARCIAWLRGIQGTGRFALNVHFLSDRETAALGEMVDALMPLAEAQQAEELRELRKVYGVDK